MQAGKGRHFEQSDNAQAERSAETFRKAAVENWLTTGKSGRPIAAELARVREQRDMLKKGGLFTEPSRNAAKPTNT